jgi:hypothetical protein
MLLTIGRIVGVAIHRAVATGCWQELPLLGALLFSVTLVHLAPSDGP